MLADATSTIISAGIGVGAFIALFFELFGVIRDRSGTHEHDIETITGYVRWIVKRSIAVRVLVGVFVLSLFGHFMWGSWLLP